MWYRWIKWSIFGISGYLGAWESIASYEQLEQSMQDPRPMLLVFSGPTWCPWSIKMEEEVFQVDSFQIALSDAIHVVAVDIPQDHSCILSKGKLMELYDIQQLPALVMLSKEKTLIKKEGILPLTAKEMGEYLLEGFSVYEAMEHQMATSYDEQQWRNLYQLATHHQFISLQHQILDQALKHTKEPFFFLKQYEKLLKTKKLRDLEVIALRKKICQIDPKNKEFSHLSLAMIEFGKLQMHRKKGKKPKETIRPLLEYLQGIGEKDHSHRWEVEQTIAQYLLEKGEKEGARFYGKKAHEHAPFELKATIERFLSDI